MPQTLDYKSLLELASEGGVIRFVGQRALLIDAVAMGLLRKYLVENFGSNAARAVLTQFGFAQGWRMAEAVQAEVPLENGEWRRAFTRIHALSGLFSVESGMDDPLSAAGSVLVDSYEAEQHVMHLGRSDDVTCWTIAGLVSGCLSRMSGEEIYVLEDKCMGKGDVACHLVGKTRGEWGGDRSELRFFDNSRLHESLELSLQRVTESLKATEKKLMERRRALNRVARVVEQPLGIIATSAVMRQLVDLTERVAKVHSTVLITGENGTGKERIARLLHAQSTRAEGPFLAVNCGAIAESLLESELFGHARGSFTGANQDRLGLFESANGGTLLLDEIGEVSATMQVKLLRVLQERELRRVGEARPRKVDVRILAATNRNLTQALTDGSFRPDLYYRLKVVELHVPSLRERRDDILPLARSLLAEASLRMKRKVSGLTPEVATQLIRYSWPGNVRELENTMERAVALARGARVELEDLPEEIRKILPVPRAHEGAVMPLGTVERDYILAALELNGGNQTHTAAQLQIGSATLYRKLRSYRLSAEQTAEESEPASR